MRVPSDPNNPTYDHTFNVGFMRWLKSNAAERREWARRRNAAIKTSRSVRYLQNKQDQADQRKADRKERKRN